MTDLINAVKKEILENESPDKVVNIIEKVLEFNEQQKGKGIKTLILEQFLQRLPISLAQGKAANARENLLNEICQFKMKLLKSI